MARSASMRSIPCRLRMAIRVSPERTVMGGGRVSSATAAATAAGPASSAAGLAGRGGGPVAMRLTKRPLSPRSTSMRRPFGSSISSRAMRGSKPGSGLLVIRTVIPAGRRLGLNTRRRLCTRASASGLRTSASRSRSIRVLPACRVRRNSMGLEAGSGASAPWPLSSARGAASSPVSAVSPAGVCGAAVASSAAATATRARSAARSAAPVVRRAAKPPPSVRTTATAWSSLR